MGFAGHIGVHQAAIRRKNLTAEQKGGLPLLFTVRPQLEDKKKSKCCISKYLEVINQANKLLNNM